MTRKELIDLNRRTLSLSQHILDINGFFTSIVSNGIKSYDVVINGGIKASYRTKISCKRYIIKLSIETLTKHIKQ